MQEIKKKLFLQCQQHILGFNRYNYKFLDYASRNPCQRSSPTTSPPGKPEK